jgi:uncharacterized membrane protein
MVTMGMCGCASRPVLHAVSASHAAFASAFLALGVLGFIYGDFALVWQVVPNWVPARTVIAYGCATLMILAGAGLLWPPTALGSSVALTLYLALWLLLLRVPALFSAPLVEVSWSGCGENAVLLAGSLALLAALAPALRARFASLTGVHVMTAAQYLFGFALIPCGLAHVAYAQATAALVPRWLPGHLFWAYATAAAYIAAAAAVLFRRKAHAASGCTALMMSAFTVLVWVPRVAHDPAQRFAWTALLISSALSVSSWVVADSFRSTPECTPSTPRGNV